MPFDDGEHQDPPGFDPVDDAIRLQKYLAQIIAPSFGYGSTGARHRGSSVDPFAQAIHPAGRSSGISERDVIRDLDQVAFRTRGPGQLHLAFVR